MHLLLAILAMLLAVADADHVFTQQAFMGVMGGRDSWTQAVGCRRRKGFTLKAKASSLPPPRNKPTVRPQSPNFSSGSADTYVVSVP